MKIDEILDNVKRIRQRLRFPPNAVPDHGIDITRKSTGYKGDTPPPGTPPKKKLEEPVIIPDVVFPVTFNDILYAVSRAHHVPVEAIKGDRRYKAEVIARRVIIHLSLKMLGRSLMSIARELNKDHTSILYARRKIEQSLQSNLKLRNEVQAIEESILGPYRNSSSLPAIRQSRVSCYKGAGHQIEGIPSVADGSGILLAASGACPGAEIDQGSLHLASYAESTRQAPP